MHCSISGCTRPVVVKKRQLCQACYSRLRRHGDPSEWREPLKVWPTQADCASCGREFNPTVISGGRPSFVRRTCSSACARAAVIVGVKAGNAASVKARSGKPQKLRLVPCPSCGTVVETRGAPKSCPACRVGTMRSHWRRKNAQRRGAAIIGRRMTIAELGERDGWRCHLCRRKVDARRVSPHPLSATFDHLIPIADGGTDEPANLRLAHRRCNTRRGTGGIVQLLLVG